MVYLIILLCTETLDIRYWERRRSVSTLSSSHNYLYPGSDGWLEECSSSYPITGILAVSISKLNKASTSMPGGSRAHLYKSLSKPDDLCLPGEIWRSSVFQWIQKGSKQVSCRSRATHGNQEGVGLTGAVRWQEPVFLSGKFLSSLLS